MLVPELKKELKIKNFIQHAYTSSFPSFILKNVNFN